MEEWGCAGGCVERGGAGNCVGSGAEERIAGGGVCADLAGGAFGGGNGRAGIAAARGTRRAVFKRAVVLLRGAYAGSVGGDWRGAEKNAGSGDGGGWMCVKRRNA